MARKKSGGFGKVLEFIGLVDDDEPREVYEDEFESGNYGKPQAYAPQRPQRTQERPRQEVSRRYNNNYEPTRTPRMSRSQQPSRFDGSRNAPQGGQRRPAPREEQRPQRYDYSPRASRFGSLDDEAPRFEAQQSRAPRMEGASRQRTVMYSLRTLKDCCEVIDNLIMNNTVVLTLDEMDPALMQRAVDTLSGAVFALRATIRKASDCTYLIAPMTVEVNETYDVDDRFF
ncbi:MAG: cell division protein SepF [Clostridia bacterium]|nr:cell division protein SepF [Clostridia bacterium]